jgi:hypothetical protein
MDLLKRDFTLGTDTCGFVSGFSCNSCPAIPSNFASVVANFSPSDSGGRHLRETIGVLYE